MKEQHNPLQPEQITQSYHLIEQVKAIYENTLCDKPDFENLQILEEKEGLRILGQFLSEQTQFSSLQPWIINIEGKSGWIKKGKKSINPSYRFLIHLHDKHHRFQLTIPHDINSHTKESLLCIPKTYNKGEKAYYWLDIYIQKQTEGKNVQFPLISGRLIPENKKSKIDWRHWHFLEEQLLVDFIQGENGILFDDLVSFDTKRYLYEYWLGGYKHLKIYPNESFLKINIVRFIPKRDKKKYYTWIDVYGIKENQAQKEVLQLLLSYQMTKGQKSIKVWAGYERQLLLDYLHGKKTFQDLIAIPLFVTNETTSKQVIRYNKKPILINMIPFIEFQEKDIIKLCPEEEINQESTWILEKNGRKLVQYVLSKDNYIFLKQKYLTNEIQLTFNEQTQFFVDAEGNNWETQRKIYSDVSKKYRIGMKRINSIIQMLPSVSYRDLKTSNASTLYKVNKLEQTLQELGIPRREQSVSIDPDEANEWLEQLLEGE